MKLQTNKDLGVRNEQELVLLQQVASEDRAALTELYHLYHPRLFKFVFRLTRSFGAADELVNDIMLTVWRKASSFRGESKVSTWIFGIAYRQTMRRVSRKQLAITPFANLDNLPTDHDVDLEQVDWVQIGLNKLPVAQQLAVVLVFYVGLSYEEIAAVTNCPVNTVKTRMFHARRKLKESLTAAALPGPTCEENRDD